MRARLAVVASAAVCAAGLVTGGGVGQAEPRVECKDVFVLAVPGTWETTAKADRNVVPGMLSKVTNPVRAAVRSGTPITAPTSTPVQIGQEKQTSSSGALGSLVGSLLDTGVSALSKSTPGTSGTATSTPTTADPTTTTAPASDRSHGAVVPADSWGSRGPTIRPVETTTTSAAPSTSTAAPSEDSTEPSTTGAAPSSGDQQGGGAIGKSVGFEQIPYVAQVGGPLAKVVTGNPLTLGQSRAAGTAALRGRLSTLGKACPSAKFAVLGYSQGSLIAGDELSAAGNGHGALPDARYIAGGLLSDPARTPTTANIDSESAAPAQQTVPGSETFVGPNVSGQGAVGARPDGFGTLADRVTSFCAEGDAICSLTGKSKAIEAVVPLLNLRAQDIGPYVSGRVKTLLTNIATADPADIEKAVTSVISAVTSVAIAGATNPYAIPLELARVVFASSMLDDIGKVVKMPEYDAFLSLVKPDELVTQVVQVSSYALLGVHQAYDRRPVNAQGDSATQFLAKWLLGRIESS